MNNILDGSRGHAQESRVSSAFPPSGAHRAAHRTDRDNERALFLVGFITFALLYAAQPLLPAFAQQFGIRAADSALALSVSIGTLALALFVSALRGAATDRRRLMLAALLAAAAFNALSAVSSTWSELLWCRALMGLCLGAVPATAMAYVAEAVPVARLPRAMGTYVAGTALGGMCGRVGMGVMADLVGWPACLLAVSALCVPALMAVARMLPPAQHPVSSRLPHHAAGQRAWVPWAVWRRVLLDPRLPRLYLCGALASGLFVAAYNYAGFRLQAPPLSLRPAHAGLIFACYIFGVASSGLVGRWAGRYGLGPVAAASAGLTAVGLALALVPVLPVFVAGLSLMTFGFFALHAVCSGWAGREGGMHKAQATAAYLLCYYLGGGLLGWAGGWLWEHGGWPMLTVGLGTALAGIAWQLRALSRAPGPRAELA